MLLGGGHLAGGMDVNKPILRFRQFDANASSLGSTWLALHEQAAAFATKLGPEGLVSISAGSTGAKKQVTVWFWDDADHPIETQTSFQAP